MKEGSSGRGRVVEAEERDFSHAQQIVKVENRRANHNDNKSQRNRLDNHK